MFGDNEEAIAALGRKALEKFGYRVETFTSPETALEAFQKQPDAYDLVITDKNMPRMGGQDLAAALTAIRDDLPVLIASGYHGKNITEENNALSGRIRYIQKPLGYCELARAVRETLDSNRAQAGGPV